MIVIIMKMIVMIKKNIKNKHVDKAKQINSYEFHPFSFRLRTEWQSGQTNGKKEMLRNQSNQCEIVPHSHLSLQLNKPNVTQTCLRC